MADPTKNKNKDQSNIAESPVSEVFEGRHPSASEQRWAETTLAQTLEKAPEKPIAASTGVNLDQTGQARFTTISDEPVRRLYTQADLPQDWTHDQALSN